MSIGSALSPRPSAPRPSALRRLLRAHGLVLLLLALAAAGLAGLSAATGWDEMGAALDRLTPAMLGVLLALSLMNYALRGLRWHLAARALGLRTGVTQDLRHFVGGFAMTVTPGRLGELVRLRWLRRETGWPVARSAPLVLADRAGDLAAMALLLGGALLLSAGGIAGALPVAVLAIGAAVVVTRPRLAAWAVTLGWRATGRWPRVFARARGAARTLGAFSRPGVLSAGLALGVAGWLAEGLAFHLLLVWMGADIGLAAAVAIFVFATLAGGLTGAPGGLGGAEAAMVALLGLQGVPLEVALPATAVIRLTTLWFAIGLGLAVFPLAEARSRRAADALEAG
jgi:uncharacterized membrane protein YbhN (UPF0104 family)